MDRLPVWPSRVGEARHIAVDINRNLTSVPHVLQQYRELLGEGGCMPHLTHSATFTLPYPRLRCEISCGHEPSVDMKHIKKHINWVIRHWIFQFVFRLFCLQLIYFTNHSSQSHDNRNRTTELANPVSYSGDIL